MKIKIPYSDNTSSENIQLFFESVKEQNFTDEEKKLRQKILDTLCILEKVTKIGYREFGKKPLISIEKNDKYVFIEIDENAEIID